MLAGVADEGDADFVADLVVAQHALQRFGVGRGIVVDLDDEVANPLTDMIVTALLIASERQGRLSDLLGEVAASARATATMRLRVEAARARTYVTTRLIIGVTVSITAWLVLARRDYLQPFDGVAGQVMLVIIGAVFAVSGLLMQRVARPDEADRLLARVDSDGAWP